MYDRFLKSLLSRRLDKGFVEILFGARQTGKTTLLRGGIRPTLVYDLSDPVERSRLLADPGVFRRECEALPLGFQPAIVWVDEVQSVPAIFDQIQSLYDGAPRRWKFLLSGSCARRLRGAGVNLLPGRAIMHQLHPLVCWERPALGGGASQSLILPSPEPPLKNPFPAAGLETRLAFGELPGVAVLEDPAEKALVLKGYSAIHLQEEIRREALVRDWGLFANFLRLAALESGQLLNYSGISREIGVSVPTIKSHFGLLKEMFIGFEVPAFSGSPRKNLLSTPRFLFADLGLRHAAAGLDPGTAWAVQPGNALEHWVGCELHKRLGYLHRGSLSYFRTKGGSEIDFIVEIDGRMIPIEVKWTDRPTSHDARHLREFLKEHPQAEQGFVVCRCPRPAKLDERIQAIPWSMI